MFCSHLYLLARDNLTCVEDRVILLLSVLTEIRGVDQLPQRALPAPLLNNRSRGRNIQSLFKL